MIQLTLTATIHPSEDEAILREIFSKFGEGGEIEVVSSLNSPEKTLTMSLMGLNSLFFLFNQVRKTRTVEAFRQHLLNQIEPGDTQTSFLVNKQVLTKDKVVLCRSSKESPLGPIRVTLQSNDILELINYLFPPTEKGKVIEANFTPQG
jgi:uncharacterized protein